MSEEIDLIYNCTKICNSPKIQFQVFGEVGSSNLQLIGYGTCYLPLKPGNHELEIPLYRPQGTYRESLLSYYLNIKP
eukprot:UN19492